eukprot:Gregarina_sp_Poly_1__660@NODE_1158_length_4907_cov_145_518182_g794_i0_p1_GENE_NODE_1158_length_4907_cov_145_518182_g794_i0NODE_1158_length_4907_cov_145_518182_g794_i0_p1_ORF_typecomplete_len1446_score239_23Aminotran_5/PF00266_19/8_9e45ATP_bind_3/PF01171_20/5_6e02ATP_bind_3/PF01171_20/4_7e39PAPS_reduct/PF01507_19/0_00027zfC2H2_jaz/PF12171_8/0_00014zfC2H2_jaz/PF12171_8/1_1e04QueC/PF06508_13/0_0045zfmet/PF12874_7/0_015zfmet/PF12874_7/2_4e03zfC2H2_2/PF12756_7/0_03zfC2H2_2/PF12756_7/2_5e03SelA/PF0384
MKPKKNSTRTRIVIFLLDPTLHHSSLLPFKELRDRYEVQDNLRLRFYSHLVDNDIVTGHLSISHLTELLAAVNRFRDSLSDPSMEVCSMCILSGASNVTGVKLPIVTLNKLVHQYHSVAIWDLASAMGSMVIDLSPKTIGDADGYIDAAFMSTHKLVGGPDTSGLLAIKKCFLANQVPSHPGGGVVRFVSKDLQLYSMHSEVREESGTPNIVACIRSGMVFKVASQLPVPLVASREAEYLDLILNDWSREKRIHILGPVAIGATYQASTAAEMRTQFDALKKVALSPRKSVIAFMVKYGNKLNDLQLQRPATASDVIEGATVKSFVNRQTSGGLYLHHNFVSAVLNDVFGIQARPGCACAGPLSQYLLGFEKSVTDQFAACLEETGADVLRPGFVRISVHYTMSWDEIQLIAAAVPWIAKFGWRLLPFYTFNTHSGEWTQNLIKPSKFRKWLSVIQFDASGKLKLSDAVETASENSAPPEKAASFKRDPRRIPGAVALPGMGTSTDMKDKLLATRGALKKAGTTKTEKSKNGEVAKIETKELPPVGTSRVKELQSLLAEKQATAHPFVPKRDFRKDPEPPAERKPTPANSAQNTTETTTKSGADPKSADADEQSHVTTELANAVLPQLRPCPKALRPRVTEFQSACEPQTSVFFEREIKTLERAATEKFENRRGSVGSVKSIDSAQTANQPSGAPQTTDFTKITNSKIADCTKRTTVTTEDASDDDGVLDPEVLHSVTTYEDSIPEELGDFYRAANKLIDSFSSPDMDKSSSKFERRLANLNKRGLHPPLPAEWANLLWFALPGDAVYSLRLFERTPFNAAEANPEVACKPGTIGWPFWYRRNPSAPETPIVRPTDSIFEVRLFETPAETPVFQEFLPSMDSKAVEGLVKKLELAVVECDACRVYPPEATLTETGARSEQRRSEGGIVSVPDTATVTPGSTQCGTSRETVAPSEFKPDGASATSKRSTHSFDHIGSLTSNAYSSQHDSNPGSMDEFVKDDKIVIPKALRKSVGRAIQEFDQIREGDRILIGLSGGKDSLTMLHVLLDLQHRAPVQFSIAAATVDPQTPEYNPSSLVAYLKSLNVEYHLLSYPIIELAKERLQKDSLCAFCARMKRGLLYSCMKSHNYNVLALGQHLDDIAESFLMSAFYNGSLNTMKAHYKTGDGDLRIIRPLIFTRERDLAQFAESNRLPVIVDNCPACFSSPTERLRMKHLLAEQEYEFPNTLNSISKALMPLMKISNVDKNEEICSGMCSKAR